MTRQSDPLPGWFMLFIAGVCLAAFLLFLCWAKPANAGPVTRVFESLAETVNLTEWDYQQENIGAVIDDSNLARYSIGRGIIATAIADVGQRQATVQKRYTGGAHNHVRVMVNPYTLNSTGGTSANRNIIQCYKSGTGIRLVLSLSDLGSTFALSVQTTDDDFSGSITPIDTIGAAWNEIYVYEKCAAEPNGIMRVYVDGALKFAADTLDTDGSKWDSLRVGFNTIASTTNSGWIAFDDIVVDTMPCAPPCGIEPVKAEYDFSSPFGGF